MGLKGILTPRGVISGSWQTFNGNYNKLSNKPTLNGVVIEGDKTSEDYHIEAGGGGGGGTTDYDDLDNKPQVNDVTLSGNKSLDDLGIQSKISYPMDSTKYLDGEGNFTTPPSGSTYSNDILYQQNYLSTNPSTITLSNDYDNYNYIYFYMYKRDDSGYYDYLPVNIIPIEFLNDALNGVITGRPNVINISGWQPMSQYLRIKIISKNTFQIVVNNSNLLIRQIRGIKF